MDDPNRLSNWPLGIRVSQGKLLSQLRGIKLLGPDSEITISKSSLSLTLTPQFLITWKSWWPFPLASMKPNLGSTLAGSPGTAQETAEQHEPVSMGQRPKKPIGFLQISTSVAGGAARDSDALTQGHGCWGLQLGKKPQMVQPGSAGGSHICSSPMATEARTAFSPPWRHSPARPSAAAVE